MNINKKLLLTIIKWISIILIVVSILFLILTYTSSLGFNFNSKWKDNSGIANDGFPIAETQKSGSGPLQIHTMEFLIAFFGGGALGFAGALLQKVTKNRLAEVSILGIGSLNILFIYIYSMSLGAKAFGNSAFAKLMPIFLIIVSILGTLIIWAISRSKNQNKNTFVIIGIAIQLFVEALSVIVVNPQKLLQSSSNTGANSNSGKKIWQKIQGYTLGDIRAELDNKAANSVQWWLMISAIILIVLCIVAAFFIRRKIDTLETSEEIAHSTSININRLKLVIYLIVAVLAGTSSAILGTVALLGIIAPSIARLLFKNNTTPVVIASFLIGGILVSLASFISTHIGLGIYVGILSTAIITPYFIYLMIRSK